MTSTIDLRQRLFPSSLVYNCVIRIYGKEPSHRTWQNWRKWAQVPKHAHTMTFRQFCALVAIAHFRKHNQRLSIFNAIAYDEIEAAANSEEVQGAIASAVLVMDRNAIVAGVDAVEALQQRGISVSWQALYRKVPRFSRQQLYKVGYLQELVS